MNKRITYPIEVTKDIRSDIKDLLKRSNIICSVGFDKWNNTLLLEVEDYSESRRKPDNFELSDGNLKVLETIPRMMRNDKWRRELRKLVLDYIAEQEINNRRI